MSAMVNRDRIHPNEPSASTHADEAGKRGDALTAVTANAPRKRMGADSWDALFLAER
jgi:hypothetical protein